MVQSQVVQHVCLGLVGAPMPNTERSPVTSNVHAYAFSIVEIHIICTVGFNRLYSWFKSSVQLIKLSVQLI